MEKSCIWFALQFVTCDEYFIIAAPLYLGYPVLYFKLSENVVGSRQEIDKVRSGEMNSWICMMSFAVLVPPEYSSSRRPFKTRNTCHHTRVLRVSRQDREDIPVTSQGKHSPVENRHWGQGGDWFEASDQDLDEEPKWESRNQHQGSDWELKIWARDR